MQKKLRITVEGRSYIVTVEELTEHGGAAPLNPSIAGTGAPTIATTPSPTPPPSSSPAPAPVPAQSQSGDVISPLGGVVDSVEVSVGQAIAAGDKLVVIEAMKMKTPIHAHQAGTVATIRVRPGDGVDAGQILLTLG